MSKGYSRDNKLIFPKELTSTRRFDITMSTFHDSGLCSMFQGLGCSPIKVVCELGSKRHETVRSISDVGIRALRRPFLSMRRPRRTHLWCTNYRAHSK